MTQNLSAHEIVSTLSLKEKLNLIIGKNVWETFSLEKAGLKSVCMNDGPHGIRKPADSTKQDYKTFPSTCFPCEALMACSFDKKLIYKVGEAIASEANKYSVDLVLGPGINIKRNPLCGRNFEYLSEDPYLAGKMAANYINGIQKHGVGACIKHFALNNQDSYRFSYDAIVDQRALNEIYLRAFEIALNESNPEAIMASYNKVNGLHSTENPFLLHTWLRNKQNYKGMAVSDWNAVSNTIDSINAGLDLTMPFFKRDIKTLIDAYNKNIINHEALDNACEHVIDFILKHQGKKEVIKDSIFDDNYSLAYNVARESIVLAKNKNRILPLEKSDRVAFIGPYLYVDRYQGGGSSNINPYKTKKVVDALINRAEFIKFAQGCSGISSEIDEDLMHDAIRKASGSNKVVLFLGTQPTNDSEGFDRNDISLPSNQIRLLNEILQVNKNVIVVISSGSVVNIPQLDDIKGVVINYLGGVGIADAVADILYGIVSPCGKLAETWIDNIESCPSYNYFHNDKKHVEYRESTFVGYRFYEKVQTNVAFPFGYGLSYSKFSYSNINVIQKEIGSDSFVVSLDVTNDGKMFAKDVIELYISDLNHSIEEAPYELQGFEKVGLNSGESKKVIFELTCENFQHFSTQKDKFVVISGKYKISLGTSCRDFFFSKEVNLKGNGNIVEKKLTSFDAASKDKPLRVNDADFNKLLRRFNISELNIVTPTNSSETKKELFTSDSTLEEIKGTFIGKIIYKKFNSVLKKMKVNDPISAEMSEKCFDELPIRIVSSQGLSEKQVNGLVDLANKKYFSGIIKLLFK
jgi:beta-glucosidase